MKKIFGIIKDTFDSVKEGIIRKKTKEVNKMPKEEEDIPKLPPTKEEPVEETTKPVTTKPVTTPQTPIEEAEVPIEEEPGTLLMQTEKGVIRLTLQDIVTLFQNYWSRIGEIDKQLEKKTINEKNKDTNMMKTTAELTREARTKRLETKQYEKHLEANGVDTDKLKEWAITGADGYEKQYGFATAKTRK